MSRKYPKYELFVKNIWSKLNKEEKSCLFYWSLWDPSSWEETKSKYMPDFDEKGKNEVFNILKDHNKTVDNLIENNPDSFLATFVMGEYLSNYAFAYELLEKINQEDDKWELDPKEIEAKTRRFPDIITRSSRTRVNIEIKGGHSGSDLARIIKKSIKPNLDKKEKGHTNFLLLLIFPECKNENSYRINQLVEGFYISELIIAENDNIIDDIKINGVKKKKRRVLCQYIEKESQENGYSLFNLVEKVANKYFSYID